MPKIVDHHERRTLLAEAVMRVAATRGLPEVSLRHVADEAGVSVGMVQHYFRTKDQLMTFALKVISERVEARLVDKARRYERPGMGSAWEQGARTPKETVRDLLIEMLPIDEVRHAEGQVGLAFHAYAAVRPHVADGMREDSERMQTFLADQLRQAQRAGDAPARLRPEQEARTLLALVEGLSIHVLGQGYDPAAALANFDDHLDSVFTAEDSGSSVPPC